MIVIVDGGLGNLGSIYNMLKKVGEKSVISSDPGEISNAEKLILPGVGSFDTAINNLRELNLIDVLNKKVLEDQVPILGICLGMQLMTSGSEEGTEKGFGWVDARTVKFDLTKTDRKFHVPHMGWNNTLLKKDSPIFEEMYEDPRFYFVHSYYVRCNNTSAVLTSTDYSLEFHSAFEQNNIIGVQFHPEKSHKYGMKLLANFAKNY